MSNQQKRNTFFGSAAVLAVTTILVKIIGALYKIPLGVLLTDAAYGDFNAAYNIYNFFLTISTAGLPVALSKTVSEANTLGRRNQVGQVFRVAFCAFLVMGLVSFFCMSVLAQFVAGHIIENEKAVYCVMALSPAVLCTCCCSAFRGYAQGHMNMVPTGVSQIIEAASKLFIGLGLAMLVARLAIQPQEVGEQMTAVGAIAGVSVGSVLSVAFLAFQHTRARRSQKGKSADVPDSSRTILTNLLKLAVPITLSSCTMSIVTLIDTKLVMSQLQTVFQGIQDGLYQVAGGGFLGIYDKAAALFAGNVQAQLSAVGESAIDPILDSARSLYGIYGKAMNIYNLPFSLMIPLTACIVPAVSACLARRDRKGARRIGESALRMAALIALPCGFGLLALGGPIMQLLYFGKVDPDVGGPLLCILGVASIFVCFQLIGTAILQAHGIVNLPIVTVVIGGVVKILVNYALVGRPDVMIFGAPVGTLCCFMAVSVLNLTIIKRIVPHPPRYLTVFVKPLIASALMAAAAWASHGFFDRALRELDFLWHSDAVTGVPVFSRTGGAMSTCLAILVGVAVYLILVLVLRVLSREDLELMPKGEKIAKILRIK